MADVAVEKTDHFPYTLPLLEPLQRVLCFSEAYPQKAPPGTSGRTNTSSEQGPSRMLHCAHPLILRPASFMFAVPESIPFEAASSAPLAIRAAIQT